LFEQRLLFIIKNSVSHAAPLNPLKHLHFPDKQTPLPLQFELMQATRL
jgi:hypothetical protein